MVAVLLLKMTPPHEQIVFTPTSRLVFDISMMVKGRSPSSRHISALEDMRELLNISPEKAEDFDLSFVASSRACLSHSCHAAQVLECQNGSLVSKGLGVLINKSLALVRAHFVTQWPKLSYWPRKCFALGSLVQNPTLTASNQSYPLDLRHASFDR